MAVFAPYLICVVTAPLVVKIFKPVLRGTVKASVGLALEVKKAAAEAGQEFHTLATEVSADKAAEAAMSADVAKAGASRVADVAAKAGTSRATGVAGRPV